MGLDGEPMITHQDCETERQTRVTLSSLFAPSLPPLFSSSTPPLSAWVNACFLSAHRSSDWRWLAA